MTIERNTDSVRDVDLELLRTLTIERLYNGSHYVRLADIPQPFRAEFRAWMFLACCPVIDGEDPGDAMYAHDFAGYREERLSGHWRKWGEPPWELPSYNGGSEEP